MKNSRIQQAFTDIDSKYIEETVTMIENKRKVIPFSKKVTRLVASIAVTLAVVTSGLTVADAAGSMQAYEILNKMYPHIAQSITPVNKSCVDNGIKMSVEGMNVHGDSAEVYIALQDIEADRIDETTDLFDSYTINTSADQMNGCQFVSYDKAKKTATFIIFIQNMNGKKITGRKLSFSLGQLLLNKKTTETEINIDKLAYCKDSQLIKNEHIVGMGGPEEVDYFSDQYSVEGDEQNAYKPVEKVSIIGYGFVDGRLHIKTRYDENREYDNHGYISLQIGEKKIDEAYGFDYYDSSDQNRYVESVYDVSEDEIAGAKICGKFVTCDTRLTGDWKVSTIIK